MIRTIIITFQAVALCISLIWAIITQEWEPIITTIGFLIGLIIYMYEKGENGTNNISMTQTGGENSKNYQSSGKIEINN